MPLYTIGDIHGQATMLDAALARVTADGGSNAAIVFLGDYTDRGPDSRGVLARLSAGQRAGRPWIFLKGNHDRMFLRFLREGIENDANIGSGLSWLNPRLGGPATLASYGIGAPGAVPALAQPADGPERLTAYPEVGAEVQSATDLAALARRAVPPAHVDFLAGLAPYHLTEELLFVHAGLRPGVPIDAQAEDDLIWIRKGFLDSAAEHGRLVVHGHTALQTPRHFGNRVDLDGGAGYGRPLIAAVFEGRRVWLLQDDGRAPLEPAAG